MGTRTFNLLIVFLFYCCHVYGDNSDGEPELYYYGIEESERGLPACSERQACGALLQTHWRPRALLRLCRCARRTRCDAPAAPDRLIEINNRAHFQFCQPTTDWPECSFGETSLVVHSAYERMNPDELEQMHHKNIHLAPPEITFNCKCREPNYWKLKWTSDGITGQYQCSFLPLCTTDQYCGSVSYDLFALYQSCLCPKNHICVHNGGVTYHEMSELLYHGKGWKAYCQRLNEDAVDEDEDNEVVDTS